MAIRMPPIRLTTQGLVAAGLRATWGATVNLGNLYRDGRGVAKDYVQARRW